MKISGLLLEESSGSGSSSSCRCTGGAVPEEMWMLCSKLLWLRSLFSCSGFSVLGVESFNERRVFVTVGKRTQTPNSYAHARNFDNQPPLPFRLSYTCSMRSTVAVRRLLCCRFLF